MSKKYDSYLIEHRSNVAKGFYWLKENLPMLIDIDGKEIPGQIEINCTKEHDKSKDLKDEYDAYDAYFYGNGRSYQTVCDFKYAWLQHIHRNPHHWQYWVLINDEEGTEALEMPYMYIIEMICDWWSFSWKSGNLTEIFNWYDQHKNNMILHENTRKIVEIILNLMRCKLSPNDDAEKELKQYIIRDSELNRELYATYLKNKDRMNISDKSAIKIAINGSYGFKVNADPLTSTYDE